MTPTIEIQKRYIFGIDSANTLNNLSYYVDHENIVFLAGGNAVIQNIITGKQQFIGTTTQDFRSIGLVGSKGVLVIVRTPLSSRESVRLCVYDSRSLREQRILKFDFGHETTTKNTLPISNDNLVAIALNSNAKVFLAITKSSDGLLVVCWNIDDGNIITSSNLGELKIDMQQQVSFCNSGSNSRGALLFCVHDSKLCRINCLRIDERSSITTLHSIFINEELEGRNDDINCHCWILHSVIVVLGTKSGVLLIVEDGKVATSLEGHINSSISRLVGIDKGFVVSCCNSRFYVYKQNEISNEYEQTQSILVKESSHIERNFSPCIMASSPDGNKVCSVVPGENRLCIFDPHSGELECGGFQDRREKYFCGHRGTINDIDTCLRKQHLITVGMDCTVRIWDYEKGEQRICRSYEEEPLSVSFHPSGHYAAIGFPDKVCILNIMYDDFRVYAQFPVKMCRACRISRGGQSLAVARGNNIAIFDFCSGVKTLELKGHNAKVTEILWGFGDVDMFSIDDDGNLCRWDVTMPRRLAEYTMGKSLRLSPASCSLVSADALWVIRQGRLEALCSKLLEQKNVISHPSENVVGPMISTNEECSILFIAIANHRDNTNYFSDKIRIYSILSGKSHEFVFSAQISCMCISPDDRFLVVADTAGCISVFDVIDKRGYNQTLITAEPSNCNENNHSDIEWCPTIAVTEIFLEEKQAIIEELNQNKLELESNHKYQASLRMRIHHEELKKIEDEYHELIANQECQVRSNVQEIDCLNDHHKQLLLEIVNTNQIAIHENEMSHRSELSLIISEYQKRVKEWDLKLQEMENEKSQLLNLHEKNITTLKQKQSMEFDAKIIERKRHESSSLARRRELELTCASIEDDVDKQIENLKLDYEKKLAVERELTLKFIGENGILQKKTDALTQDIENQKESIKIILLREDEMHQRITSLKNQINVQRENILQKRNVIKTKESLQESLEKKRKELDIFKVILEDKISNLENNLVLRRENIDELKSEVLKKEKRLDESKSSREEIREKIQCLRKKIKDNEGSIIVQKQKIHLLQSRSQNILSILEECTGLIQKPDELKQHVIYLHGVIRAYPLLESTASRLNRSKEDIMRETKASKGCSEIQSLELEISKIKTKNENGSIIRHKAETDLLEKNIKILEEIKMKRLANDKAKRNLDKIVKET